METMKCPFRAFENCREDCALYNRDIVTGEKLGCMLQLLPLIEDKLCTLAEEAEKKLS